MSKYFWLALRALYLLIKIDFAKGANMNWGPFVYQYLAGAIIFTVGFVLAWRSGDHSWARREDRLTSILLIIMALAYFSGHLLWQLYGLGMI